MEGSEQMVFMFVIFISGVILGYLISRTQNLEIESEVTQVPLGNISVIEVSITERELEELLTEVETWDQRRIEGFFSNFLLPREIDVLRALVMTFISAKSNALEDLYDDSRGWLNKHQIHIASGVSRKVIYSGHGVLERLTTLVLVKRKQVSSWGRGKHKFRLNHFNDFIETYAKAVFAAQGIEF